MRRSGKPVTRRVRPRGLSLSEIMTILVAFHQEQHRNFKQFYRKRVCQEWRGAFPGVVSYQRFVEWIPCALLPLCADLKHCVGGCSGISFIDSTCLRVCYNRRIGQHRVFAGLAARGKTSVDWFFGFKLHLVVNEYGELLNIQLPPGNTDDRKPVLQLLRAAWQIPQGPLFGKVFADKGYIPAPLAQQLLKVCGIEFFAKPRRNMKNALMRLSDKLLARKRAIIESIIDQLKNISHIEHSRHRSPVNCFVNIICGLIAYSHQPKKPSLRIEWALPPAA
jgi:transposase